MARDNYDMLVDYIIAIQQKLYRIAYCYVNNREDALDIVQNAICKILENYQDLKNIDAMKTWVYRITVNESLNYIRKHKREIACEPSELKEEIYNEPAYEEGLSLYKEIHSLSQEMQTVVMLYFYEELTLKEISLVTGVNLNTVKTRLYGSLQKLKKMMREVS